MKLVIHLCLAGVFLYGHCPLCPAWVALAPGGVNWIQRRWEGICGLGAHRLPSKSARVWAVSCHPLSLFQEQERVRVSGEESGSQASCGSPWVHSSCGAATSQGHPRAVAPSAWHARVSPGRTSEPLFLLLVWGPPGGSVLIWRLLFPSHPAPCGQFFTALVWTRLSAGVTCFQEMGPWCAPGEAELSILPGAPPQDSVWHSLCAKCGSCDCSGRVGTNLFSSFPGPRFPFSFFFSFSFPFSLYVMCVCVCSCVCSQLGTWNNRQTLTAGRFVSCPDSPSLVCLAYS